MSTPSDQGWFYLDKEKQNRGPFPPAVFKALAERGEIRSETPVWTEGYGQWVAASQVTGLVPSAPSSVSSGSSAPPPLPDSSPRIAPAVPASSEPAPAPSPLPVEELKPRKGSFLFPRLVTGVILFGVVAGAVAGALVAAELPLLISVAVFVLGVGFTWFASSVAYRKERYELHPSHVLCHRGGLLSDQTTELEIRNITHVKLKLPWLRYKFFRVGDVMVESAGSSEAIVMRCVREPETIYAGVRERMQRNGYDLTQRQLLHEEQPALIAVFAEGAGLAFAILMLIVFGLSTIVGFAEEMESAGISWVLWLAGTLGVIGGACWLVGHSLDLRRRTYRVYNDVVVYEEGFLTRENAFIPYENIADASTKRSFLDQILQLYDVLVSCQGSSAEIKFRRLRRGVELSNAIDHLVEQARQKPSPAALAPESAEDSTVAARRIPRRAEPQLIAPGEGWAADLRMNAGRVLVPLMLLIPIVPLWIVAMIQAGIKLVSTRYTVRPGSIRHSYRFLTTHDREFANDKITGLVVKENPWDRLFGTVTLRFWSIGSGQSLELAHVPRASIDLAALLRQIGIPAATQQPLSIDPSFGVLTWLRARLDRLLLVFILAAAGAVGGWQFGEVFYWLLGALAFACLAGLGYASIYFSRQRLRFHPHHVEAEQGVITRHRYYARYRNVKKTEVTRYPGGHEGALQIFVAGEQQVGNTGERKGQVKVAIPCSFTSGFLPDIMEKGGLVDDILCGRVDPAPEATAAEPLEVLCEAPRAVGNTLFKLILVSIIAVPLVVLLPLTIPVTIITVKRWRYRLDAGRVVVSRGVLYRKQASILLDRIDSLRHHQGPLHKMFGNGNISIMTAGSSKPDLVMVDAPGYQRLYAEIRSLSQGS